MIFVLGHNQVKYGSGSAVARYTIQCCPKYVFVVRHGNRSCAIAPGLGTCKQGQTIIITNQSLWLASQMELGIFCCYFTDRSLFRHVIWNGCRRGHCLRPRRRPLSKRRCCLCHKGPFPSNIIYRITFTVVLPTKWYRGPFLYSPSLTRRDALRVQKRTCRYDNIHCFYTPSAIITTAPFA